MPIIFAQSFLLSLFLLSPILIFAYRKKLKGKQLYVSSLFLIKKLKQIPKRKKKIELPLRFYIELLCLMLLALAAAMPQIVEEKKHLVFLIDNSFSMRASSGLASRFSEALGKARSRIEEEDSSLFSIYSTTPKLTLHGHERVSKEQALKILSELRTEKGKDSIDLLVDELVSQSSFNELQIISDKSLKLINTKEENGLVLEEQVGSSKENSYILDLQQSQAGDKTIFNVILFHSGANATKVGLKLSLINDSGSEELAFQPGILLEENQEKSLSFSLPKETAESSALGVKLIPETAENNALTEDDELSLAKKESSSGTIYLVHDEEVIRDLGLEKIANKNFKFLKSRELSKAVVEEASAFIFYKIVPQDIPQKPSFYLLPETSSLFESAISKVSAPAISSWDKTHPLTRYLRTALLKPNTALALEIPPWASSIISTESASLLYAGESAGTRLVVSGLELLPYEGEKTASASVLLLNILNWLDRSESKMQNEFYNLASESNTHKIESAVITLGAMKNSALLPENQLKPFWEKLISLVLVLLLLELALRVLPKKKIKL